MAATEFCNGLVLPIFLLLFLGNVCVSLEATKTSGNHEQQLIRDLIYVRRIDRYSRPVHNYSETLSVEMKLWVYNILGLDAQTEKFSVNAIQYLKWVDKNLTWDPGNHDGINYLNLPDFMIWKPQIVLVNSINLREASNMRSWNFLRLKHDGTVELKAPTVLNSHCAMDVSKFPFDEHDCELVFASWTFYATHLNISLGYDDTNELQDHGFIGMKQHSISEWQLVDWESQVLYEDFGGNVLPKIVYRFKIQRSTPYYKFAVLIPVIVLMLTSLAVFWFPPMAGEKITFSGFMTLILTLLLVHLYWVVPRNANTVPGIVLLCGLSVAYVGLSLLISVITINISRGFHYVSPSPFIRQLLSGTFGKFLCIGKAKSELEHRNLNNSENAENSDFGPDEIVCREWILVAMAIDRICFYLYVISFVILLCVVFA